MSVFGWIVLSVFALLGIAIIVIAVGEFLLVQIRLFHIKIAKELEVMREDINERAASKKERLAKKRKAKDKVANQVLDVQIGKMQDKAAEKYGPEITQAPVHEKKHTQPSHAPEKADEQN